MVFILLEYLQKILKRKQTYFQVTQVLPNHQFSIFIHSIFRAACLHCTHKFFIENLRVQFPRQQAL